MKRDYLGDSYDALKRLWQQTLAAWAPLFAEPRFIESGVRHEFTLLTQIPILDAVSSSSGHSILNDPDTGIRHPDGKNQREGRTHIALPTIAMQLRGLSVKAVVTYDQSLSRVGDHEGQRRAKLNWLSDRGLFGIYYESHAPFLFACSDAHTLSCLRQRLIAFGLPKSRFLSMSD